MIVLLLILLVLIRIFVVLTFVILFSPNSSPFVVFVFYMGWGGKGKGKGHKGRKGPYEGREKGKSRATASEESNAPVTAEEEEELRRLEEERERSAWQLEEAWKMDEEIARREGGALVTAQYNQKENAKWACGEYEGWRQHENGGARTARMAGESWAAKSGGCKMRKEMRRALKDPLKAGIGSMKRSGLLSAEVSWDTAVAAFAEWQNQNSCKKRWKEVYGPGGLEEQREMDRRNGVQPAWEKFENPQETAKTRWERKKDENLKKRRAQESAGENAGENYGKKYWEKLKDCHNSQATASSSSKPILLSEGDTLRRDDVSIARPYGNLNTQATASSGGNLNTQTTAKDSNSSSKLVYSGKTGGRAPPPPRLPPTPWPSPIPGSGDDYYYVGRSGGSSSSSGAVVSQGQQLIPVKTQEADRRHKEKQVEKDRMRSLVRRYKEDKDKRVIGNDKRVTQPQGGRSKRAVDLEGKVGLKDNSDYSMEEMEELTSAEELSSEEESKKKKLKTQETAKKPQETAKSEEVKWVGRPQGMKKKKKKKDKKGGRKVKEPLDGPLAADGTKGVRPNQTAENNTYKEKLRELKEKMDGRVKAKATKRWRISD